MTGIKCVKTAAQVCSRLYNNRIYVKKSLYLCPFFNFTVMNPRFQRFLMLVILIMGSLSVHAQRNVGISFKRLFLDYQTLQDGDFGAFSKYGNGFEAGFHYPLTKNFMVNIPVKIGLGSKTAENTNQHIIGADLQLHIYPIANPNRFKPYLLGGVGFVYQEKTVSTCKPLLASAWISASQKMHISISSLSSGGAARKTTIISIMALDSNTFYQENRRFNSDYYSNRPIGHRQGRHSR